MTSALVYTREQMAQVLGMGVRTFDELRQRDETLPKPIRIAGPTDRPRWLRSQVEDWLNAKALAQQTAGGEQ